MVRHCALGFGVMFELEVKIVLFARNACLFVGDGAILNSAYFMFMQKRVLKAKKLLLLLGLCGIDCRPSLANISFIRIFQCMQFYLLWCCCCC